MIVSLPVLKRALDIDEADTSQDVALTELESRVSTWVEGQTKRRFQVPLAVTEYKTGSGTRTLYLDGNFGGPAAEDPDYVYVVVHERSLTGTWEQLTEDLDFERRGNTLVRLDGVVWSRALEYRITYEDGYHAAPGDVQALVISMVTAANDALTGEGGVVSESIGDYSYSLDAAAAAAVSGIDDIGTGTLNRWRRKLV